MPTWSLFTGNDIALAVVGILGISSVFIVLFTASGNVAKRELTLRQNARAQSDASDS